MGVGGVDDHAKWKLWACVPMSIYHAESDGDCLPLLSFVAGNDVHHCVALAYAAAERLSSSGERLYFG